MNPIVLSAGHDFKIGWIVVQLIPIAMMHQLRGEQLATEDLGHDYVMNIFRSCSARASNAVIAIMCASSTIGGTRQVQGIAVFAPALIVSSTESVSAAAEMTTVTARN